MFSYFKAVYQYVVTAHKEIINPLNILSMLAGTGRQAFPISIREERVSGIQNQLLPTCLPQTPLPILHNRGVPGLKPGQRTRAAHQLPQQRTRDQQETLPAGGNSIKSAWAMGQTLPPALPLPIPISHLCSLTSGSAGTRGRALTRL